MPEQAGTAALGTELHLKRQASVCGSFGVCSLPSLLLWWVGAGYLARLNAIEQGGEVVREEVWVAHPVR